MDFEIKPLGAAPVVYEYGADGELMAEYNGATSGEETGTRWPVTEHLGSTRLVVGPGGTAARRFDYEPFRLEIPVTAGGRTEALGYKGSTLPAQKFTGKERDGEMVSSALPSGLD